METVSKCGGFGGVCGIVVLMRFPHFVVTALLLLFSVAARTPERSAESSYEITSTQAERVAAVSQLFSKAFSLPSPLLDAHFIEQQIGDNQFGPADFTAFYALTVAPADLSAWRSGLSTLQAPNTPPRYATPNQQVAWWLTPDDFTKLTFYSPHSLTERINGWVGIAPESGKIFIYTFTT